MGLRRIRIDYSVFPAEQDIGNKHVFWDCRNFRNAKRVARRLGYGAKIYRNFNEESKSGYVVGEFWQADDYWLFVGGAFLKLGDKRPITGTHIRGKRTSLWLRTSST